MDEQEKSGSRWEDAEQLGPYQLQEQVPQDEYSQGELYRATHETSGAPALVLKPAASKEERTGPLTDLRVRIISSATPGYDAMEVEQTPWSVAPDRQSVESLVSTLEDVHEAVGRMARAFSAVSGPRRIWWHPGLGLSGAAAAGALLFALVHLAPVFQPPSGPGLVANAPPPLMRHDVLAMTETPDPRYSAWLENTTPQWQSVLARPLPREPFKGQKRPPCTRRVEVELVGACWGPHKLTAPCPDELFEHQGECYAPIFSARPPPQSLGQ
ncbi:hypothetical protein JRI60_20395 [Archangium violaceum]|uniref:hypothetical protein n=1 Tax=Archangium violaceum TaxID=83451 RepID=UPI0019525A91|nr:hypothetical protein [Archangium violaceum]QRO01218.1 hypothetical protein JRI60_20395 [Archangium violaceum]